ncbi:L-histidine N(alpha)-methyltransferase [Roseixanthobacter glucoisosaccharinicivorans]|uniref:L-histidine N(alpha)-methyltransferase n=1 Tax=Roseixanthobacter glucoisosaccharinicivorans TaxID=3119923 RepID=UPI0037283AEE
MSLSHAAERAEPLAPSAEFARDLALALSSRTKRLAPKYFYDAAGSALFEQITQLPEYYPTRTEISILRDHAEDLAALLPPGGVLVEFGSGASVKVRLLLDRIPHLAAYVPVDISAEFLERTATDLRRAYPGIEILPLADDFTQRFALPQMTLGRPLLGFFPGSTIGNFEPADARDFLARARETLGPGSRMIVGVDLVKDPRRLHAAYNDAAGVTAQFNKNVLVRANRELGTDFELSAFVHRAFFNAPASRIEMHLVSAEAQTVHLEGAAYHFAAGESLHTECSYKYTLDSFADLAANAGWRREAAWTDPDRLFSVHLLASPG